MLIVCFIFRYHNDWRSETQTVVSLLAFMHWLETGSLLLHPEAQEQLGCTVNSPSAFHFSHQFVWFLFVVSGCCLRYFYSKYNVNLALLWNNGNYFTENIINLIQYTQIHYVGLSLVILENFFPQLGLLLL